MIRKKKIRIIQVSENESDPSVNASQTAMRGKLCVIRKLNFYFH